MIPSLDSCKSSKLTMCLSSWHPFMQAEVVVALLVAAVLEAARRHRALEVLQAQTSLQLTAQVHRECSF